MKNIAFLKDNATWLTTGALLMFLSSFGQTFFISIFAGSIRSEFGLSNGAWGLIYTVGTSASAVVMLFAGGLSDHFRVRNLGAIVLGMLALACLSMAWVPSVWVLPFVIFALRFTGQGMTSHIAVVAMARWFTATRGKALSIAALGFSIGEGLLPLIFVSLMAHWAWRELWVLASVIVIALIPIIMTLLRHERTPQSVSTQNQQFGMDGKFWTRKQAFSHPLFWMLVPALLGPSAFGTAFFFHQVHYAEINGWQHVQLVALFPIYTGFATAAMFVSGWALDRFGTPRLMPFYQIPLIFAFLLFGLSPSLLSVIMGLLIMAITTGANSTIPNAFWAEFYGTMHIGSIKSMAAAVMVFGSAIGPGLTGLLIDLGFSLDAQYIGVSAYFVFASILMALGITRHKRTLTVSP